MPNLFDAIAYQLPSVGLDRLTISPRRRLFATGSVSPAAGAKAIAQCAVNLPDTLRATDALFIESLTGGILFTAGNTTLVLTAFLASLLNSGGTEVVPLGQLTAVTTTMVSDGVIVPHTNLQCQPTPALLTQQDLLGLCAAHGIATTQPWQILFQVAVNNSGANAGTISIQLFCLYRLISGLSEG